MTHVDLESALPQTTVMVVSVTGSTTSGRPLPEEDLEECLKVGKGRREKGRGQGKCGVVAAAAVVVVATAVVAPVVLLSNGAAAAAAHVWVLLLVVVVLLLLLLLLLPCWWW